MGNFINELQNFQNVPRELVFDNSLSDRARFIYVFMACKPDGWEFYLEPMAKDIGYSVDTLRKYINELVASGWLIKGEQQNQNGVFGAVQYTLKATKFTDTEKTRLGKNPTLINIDCNKNNRLNKEKNEIDKSISKKAELFEKCWVAYRRKGSKKKANDYWQKLTTNEQQNVLAHITAYVSSRDVQYQKDFERYLRDKTFLEVVYSKNQIVYDPSKLGLDGNVNTVYTPSGNYSIAWDEKSKAYMYIGLYFDGMDIADGYNSATRPDKAKLVLNNGRGVITWNKVSKAWEKE